MFEKAARLKIRFETPQGNLSIEDLFEIPLTSKSGRANLDDIAKDLFRQLKGADTESFVHKPAKADEVLQLKFDIVKHVIDVRLAEAEAAAVAKANADKKQLILSIIAQKENQKLLETDLEDLKKIAESL